MLNTLFLDGRPGTEKNEDTGENKQKFLAVINGVDHWLRQKLFTYLFKLAIQGRGDWIDKKQLEPGPKMQPGKNADIHIWHLRKAIKLSGLEIQNDRHGNYRLVIDFESVGYDIDNIKVFPDDTVRRLV